MPLKMFSDKPKKPLSQIQHVLAVAAGKGGVGKSTVAVNLALALSNLGHRVGLMDTDVYGPSIRKMLPEDRMPSQKGDRIFPASCFGIKMISMAYFRKEGEASAVRAPIANSMVSQFVQQVEWGELDYLILDFPPGTGDIQLTLAQQANLSGAVMVTTPQEIALMDVKKAINLFDQLKVPILGIVENMSYYQHHDGEKVYLFGEGGGERLARSGGVPLLGQLPVDPDLCRSGDLGLSIFHRPDQVLTQSANQFIDIASLIDTHLTAIESEGIQRDFVLEWQVM